MILFIQLSSKGLLNLWAIPHRAFVNKPLGPSLLFSLLSFLPVSTSFVYSGELLDESGRSVPICIRLACCYEDKGILMKEHKIYRFLVSQGVRGIPRSYGIF